MVLIPQTDKFALFPNVQQLLAVGFAGIFYKMSKGSF